MTAVLVTGAAGGIGAATVRAFVARGHAVIALDRAEFASPDALCRAYVADLLDPPAVRKALDDAIGAGFELRHVVSIAGGALAAEKLLDDIADLPLDVFRASLEQNLTSAFVTLQCALPHLRASDGDRSVTLTSSTDAMLGFGLAAYAAAKGGLLALVRSLASPLGCDGIRINAVVPGDVPTDRNVREWAHRPSWYDDLRDATALRRLGTVDDIAQAYVALVGLRHVTGQALVVDGGLVVHASDPTSGG